jgi:hypothetical protein
MIGRLRIHPRTFTLKSSQNIVSSRSSSISGASVPNDVRRDKRLIEDATAEFSVRTCEHLKMRSVRKCPQVARDKRIDSDDKANYVTGMGCFDGLSQTRLRGENPATSSGIPQPQLRLVVKSE